MVKAAKDALKKLPETFERDEAEEDAKAALAKFLPQVKLANQEAPYFFSVAMGKPAGLVVGKRKQGQTHLKLAKKLRTGKGPVLQGVCYGEKAK